MVTYQNYSGMVEYNEDAGIFTGLIIGIRSEVAFQGRTPEELDEAFREAVDHYLAKCKEEGIEP